MRGTSYYTIRCINRISRSIYVACTNANMISFSFYAYNKRVSTRKNRQNVNRSLCSRTLMLLYTVCTYMSICVAAAAAIEDIDRAAVTIRLGHVRIHKCINNTRPRFGRRYIFFFLAKRFFFFAWSAERHRPSSIRERVSLRPAAFVLRRNHNGLKNVRLRT